MELRYIMIDQTFPVIWAGGMKHSKVAELGNVTSAGFLRVSADHDGNVLAETYGYSRSLNLSPAPRDSEYIALFLGKD